MGQVIVVGGGFSGCAAAIAARKAGAEAVLLERTNLLLGAGLRAGRMNNNVAFVATEETRAMGGSELFEALESIIIHRSSIIGEENTYVYNTALAEPVIRNLLLSKGITIRMESRAKDIIKNGKSIKGVVIDNGEIIEGDTFVDCTGSSGSMEFCNKYGNGCVMCYCYRCVAFGNRVSIATLAGAPSVHRVRYDGTPGVLGSAISLYKESLCEEYQQQLQQNGVLTLALNEDLVNLKKPELMSAGRTKEQMRYLNVVDIGTSAKCVGVMTMELADFRKIKGLENAQIEDPMAGGKSNKISGIDITLRENTMQVKGFDNLFCAGEKGSPQGGIPAVISTGYLAGHNAVRWIAQTPLLTLPVDLMVGDYVVFTGQMLTDGLQKGGIPKGCSLSNGHYVDRVKQMGFYTTDAVEIARRVTQQGLAGEYNQKLI